MTVSDPPVEDRIQEALRLIEDASNALAGKAAVKKMVVPAADAKCDYEMPVPTLPFGGATSFDEVEKAIQSQETDNSVSTLTNTFHNIVDNIMATDKEVMAIDQKAQAVMKAAADLAKLMADPTESASRIGLREEEKPGVLGSIGTFVRRLIKGADADEIEQGLGRTSFHSFIDAKGNWRWLSIHTNNFRDRDGEVFPESAHKEFVALADRLQRYPELWFWHTPGSRMGFADFVDEADGFVLASGPFDQWAIDAGIPAKLQRDQDRFGTSHGYTYPEDAKEADGTINRYFTFEVSVLPKERAANPWMPLADIMAKEGTMSFRPEKKAVLAEYLGTDKTDALERGLENLSKELEAAGIDWKDVTDALAASTAVPAAQVVSGAAPADAGPATQVEADAEAAAAAADALPGSIEDRVGRIESAVLAMAEGVKGMAETVNEMKLSDDERLANLNSPRRRAPDPARRPSGSSSNEVDIETVASVKEQIENEDPEDPPAKPASRYVKQLVGQ